MRNSGIYKIVNNINGMYYVGSSSELHKRKQRHFHELKNNKHHCIYLQRAYNKYGEDAFEFIVVFNCLSEYCKYYEDIFISMSSLIYNTSKDSTAPMRGRKHTPETLEKFKNRKYSSGKNHYLYGKKMPEETKAKILKKKIGSKRSQQTKDKMSETAKRINAISRIDRTKQYKRVIDNDGIVYESMVEAASKNNVSVQTVCDILKGRHSKTRKGKSFKYAA